MKRRRVRLSFKDPLLVGNSLDRRVRKGSNFLPLLPRDSHTGHKQCQNYFCFACIMKDHIHWLNHGGHCGFARVNKGTYFYNF